MLCVYRISWRIFLYTFSGTGYPPLIEYPYLSMSKERYFFFSLADIERQQTLLRNLDIKLAFGRIKNTTSKQYRN